MLVGPEFDGVVREVKDILVMAESAACSAEESTSRLRFDGLQGIAKGVDGGFIRDTHMATAWGLCTRIAFERRFMQTRTVAGNHEMIFLHDG